jgi:hypothetical protein
MEQRPGENKEESATTVVDASWLADLIRAVDRIFFNETLKAGAINTLGTSDIFPVLSNTVLTILRNQNNYTAIQQTQLLNQLVPQKHFFWITNPKEPSINTCSALNTRFLSPCSSCKSLIEIPISNRAKMIVVNKTYQIMFGKTIVATYEYCAFTCASCMTKQLSDLNNKGP